MLRTAPMMRTTAVSFLSALALAALAGCGYAPVPLPPTGPGPFGRVLFLGDSLSTGFQNGSLLDTQQPNGFGSLLARQANFPLVLPLIAKPGAPGVLKLVSVSPLPVIQQTPGITTGRDNPGTQVNDLAVPGQLLHDLIYRTPTLDVKTDEDIITDLVLGLPVGDVLSQLGEAVALQPTSVFLWTGNNDALLGDDAGSAAAMTSLGSFAADYSVLIGALKTRTSAHLFVANIPDVTAIPYMTPATVILGEITSLTGIPGTVAADGLGLEPGDLVNGQGLRDIEAEIAGLANGGTLTPLAGSDVLTPSEIAEVQATIASYNQVIAGLVAQAGGTLVDVHSYFAALAATGATINGYHGTVSFLGGLFGLDGVHPTNTGYALLANYFIAATNTALGLSTPMVDVSAIAAKDPYFGPNIMPAAATGTTMRIPTAAAMQSSRMIRGFKEPAIKRP